MARLCSYLNDPAGGLYVMRFPDRVKFGRAQSLRQRIRRHRRDGAVAGYVFFDHAYLEPAVLAEARQRFVQLGPGRTESFSGLSLMDGVRLVREVLDKCGKHDTIGAPVDFDRLFAPVVDGLFGRVA